MSKFQDLYEQITDTFLIEAARLKAPILPLGKVNIKTGSSKVFNIYDTWFNKPAWEHFHKEGDPLETVVVIKSSTSDDVKAVFGSYGHYHDKEDFFHAIHDQTGRQMFSGKVLGEVHFKAGDDLEKFKKEFADLAGGNTVSGYVFK